MKNLSILHTKNRKGYFPSKIREIPNRGLKTDK